MPRRDIISEPEASVVADVLETAIQLRQARYREEEAAAKPGADMFSLAAASAWQQRSAAALWVHELMSLIASRARRADMDGDELLALANAVIDGRKRLPEGVEPMGMAA